MFEQFRQEGARMIAESDALLLKVRRQAEDESARYKEQGTIREMEMQRFHRALQAAEKMLRIAEMLHEYQVQS